MRQGISSQNLVSVFMSALQTTKQTLIATNYNDVNSIGALVDPQQVYLTP